MRATDEQIKKITKVYDYQIKRVFWDIINSPECYPSDWIISDGIPYWKWHKKRDKDAQIIIDLYEDLLKSRK